MKDSAQEDLQTGKPATRDRFDFLISRYFVKKTRQIESPMMADSAQMQLYNQKV